MHSFRYFPAVMLAAASACLPLLSQNPKPPASVASVVVNRITTPIDETNLVALPGNVHPLAQARFDRGAAAASRATGRILLVLQRSAAQQQMLTQYLSDLQDPSSPSFHKWLTPAQYGAAFGITDSDLDAVETWLQSQGFKVENVPQARNVIQFSGTVGQVQSAFQTSIHEFLIGGETHYANISDPQIPAALVPVVAGVGPLNDFHPKPPLVLGPHGHYDTSTGRIKPDLTLEDQSGFLLFADPADAATIYDTPNTSLNLNYTSGTTYDGTGVTIGVAGVSNIPLSDIENYRTAFLGETTTNANLPTVIVDGNDPGLPGGGWEDEAILDNEVSGGLAPKAKIYFYTSANTDLSSGFLGAVFRAIDDNYVSILSMSVAECEQNIGSAGNAAINEAAEQAAAQGITVVVASSDSGSAGCDDFDTATAAQYGFAVNGFASTPYNVAVGGTDYDVLPDAFSTYVNDTTSGTAPYYRTALKYIPENPWNDSTTVNTTYADNVRSYNSEDESNIVAGSGGLSTIYGKPSFQTSLTPTDNARDVPDVSLFAANGFYDAAWVFCSDNVADGVTSETYTECQNTNGVFTDSTVFGGVGGTSAAAPAFAGILALVVQAQGGARLGQADYILYQLAKSRYSTVFHDITTGNNSVPCVSGSPDCGTNGFLTGYNAGTGYDYATGLGSVDVSQLVKNWGSAVLTSTSTTLNINGSTAAYSGVHGATLTFNAVVNPTAATGTVAVIDTANQTAGGTTSGPQNNGQFSISLTGGTGTATYNGLPGGTYTVSGRYGGDTSDASSTSTPISVTISPEPSTTALEANAYNPLTGVGVSSSSIPYGSEVLLDAQIEGTAEGASTEGTATGTVTFSNGSTTLGTASVSANGNLASWPPISSKFVALSPGAYSVTAAYSGDASYKASTSAAVGFTVVRAGTSMTATVNPTTVSFGVPGTAVVNITTPYNLGVAPTGTVTMTANGTTVGTIPSLSATVQVLSATDINYVLTGLGDVNGQLLAPGNNVVTLTYSGDGNYASSSTTATVYDTSGIGSFALSNSGNITMTAGQTAGFTVTVTPSGGFISPVTFTCMSTFLPCGGQQTVQVSGTSPVPIAMTVSSLANTTPGAYTVTVSAVNDTGKITANTSFTVTVNSLPANAGIALTNNGPIAMNAGTTNTSAVVTVTPTNGYVGTVNQTCAVTTNLSNPTSPITCAVGSMLSITTTQAVTSFVTLTSTSATTTGAYTVTVTGTDSNNAAITGNTAIAVTVNTPPVPTITLTSSGNITVNPGATTGNQSTITVTPGGGFTGPVNMSCALTTAPPSSVFLPTCAVVSVVISGTTAATAMLTVNTTAATSGALDPPLKRFFLAGGGGVLALVLLFGIPARRRAWRALLSVLALVVVAGAIGCGGGGSGGGGGGGAGGGGLNSGTTAGNYVVTVTGADAATGTITSSVAVTVTVN